LKYFADIVIISGLDIWSFIVMKEKIHPQYEKVVVRCGCGSTFETRSTAKEIHAEICSMCHPFYTGKQKYVDTAGRIERFQKKYGRQELHQDGHNRQKTKREQKRPATIACSSSYYSCSHPDKTGLGAFCSFGQMQTDSSMTALAFSCHFVPLADGIYG